MYAGRRSRIFFRDQVSWRGADLNASGHGQIICPSIDNAHMGATGGLGKAFAGHARKHQWRRSCLADGYLQPHFRACGGISTNLGPERPILTYLDRARDTPSSDAELRLAAASFARPTTWRSALQILTSVRALPGRLRGDVHRLSGVRSSDPGARHSDRRAAGPRLHHPARLRPRLVLSVARRQQHRRPAVQPDHAAPPTPTGDASTAPITPTGTISTARVPAATSTRPA